MSDYFEGQLIALNSVVNICRSNPTKSGKELEKVFSSMIEDVKLALDKDVVRSYLVGEE